MADIRSEIEKRRTFAIISHRSEEHTSELQSRLHLVCRLLLEKRGGVAGYRVEGALLEGGGGRMGAG